ncbi:hypothetical protein [Pseudomonas shirazensis]
MERKYKLTIPEPCTENWDKMTPNDSGRFCLSCSKTVVDFTAMLPDEIQHFFIENQNNNVCGRFKKSQLNTITIQIPRRVLYTQTHYHKMFLLALFIAMGTTLFSCQDKNGNKQKIDKIEVTNENKLEENSIKGKTLRTDKNIPPTPPTKVDHIKFVKEKNTKSKTINSGKTTKQTKIIEDEVYNGGVAIETNAEYPGGIEQFYNFFGKEFKKPEDSHTPNLKIKLSFSVERNGSISFLQSEPAIDKTVEAEIIRVLNLSPKWQPAESNGKKIRMQYSLPIVLE